MHNLISFFRTCCRVSIESYRTQTYLNLTFRTVIKRTESVLKILLIFKITKPIGWIDMKEASKKKFHTQRDSHVLSKDEQLLQKSNIEGLETVYPMQLLKLN